MICLPINYYLFGKDKFISYFGYDFKIYLLYLYIELFFVRIFMKNSHNHPALLILFASLTSGVVILLMYKSEQHTLSRKIGQKI